jgi:hypothetical protein
MLARCTYERMLDWRNSEESSWRMTVEEFAEEQGYEFCEGCEQFVDAALFEKDDQGNMVCFTCARGEWEE